MNVLRTVVDKKINHPIGLGQISSRKGCFVMPNDVPANRWSWTVQDYSRELSTMEFSVQAQADYAGWLAVKNAFITASVAITNGNPNSQIASFQTRQSNEASTNVASAREKKALVRYEDNVNLKRFVVSIPTFDDTAVTFAPNSDFVDLSVAPMPAWVTAFEAMAASPYGNGVTVVSVERVGRNN